MTSEETLKADLLAAIKPLSFSWHSTDTEGDTAVILFDDDSGHTWAVTIGREIHEGTPASLSRVG